MAKKLLSGPNELPTFEAYLIDVWGVLYDGEYRTRIANDLLQQSQKRGKVALVSNTSRSSQELVGLLDEKGICSAFIDATVTSGSLCKDRIDRHLTENPNHRFKVVGTVGACSWLDSLSAKQSNDIEACDFIIAANIIYDEDQEIDRLLDVSIDRDLIVYSTNPDKIVVIGGRPYKAAGYFCDKVRQAGGHVFEYGKPNTEIFNAALSQLRVRSEHACMIGDSLETDIAGGRAAALKTILVSGCGGLTHSNEDLNGESYDYLMDIRG